MTIILYKITNGDLRVAVFCFIYVLIFLFVFSYFISRLKLKMARINTVMAKAKSIFIISHSGVVVLPQKANALREIYAEARDAIRGIRTE